MRNRKFREGGKDVWGCFRDKSPMFVLEFVHTHMAVWEQSASSGPDLQG